MDSNHLGGLQPTNSPKSVYLELAARLLTTEIISDPWHIIEPRCVCYTYPLVVMTS